MTARDELDRRLAEWMTETVSSPVPVGRFEEAMDATARRRPRPRWLAAFGSDWVGTTAPRRVEWALPGLRRDLLLAAVVALLVAAAIVCAVLVGARLLRPDPLVGRPLEPGTQTISQATWSANKALFATARFDVPAGWMTDDRDRIFKEGGVAPDGIGMQLGTVSHVYADPCHWTHGVVELQEGHGPQEPGFLEMATALAGDGAPPEETRLAGWGGWKLTQNTPANTEGCDAGEFRRWSPPDGRPEFALRAGQTDDIWLLDPDREMVIVHVWHFANTSAGDWAEMSDILNSMSFAGP